MAPLDAPWLVRIPLAGFGDAVVAVPTGATAPRPVLVGVHGAQDRPEWACGEWMGITQGYPFILCPHGVPADAAPEQLVGFATADTLRREIDAGLAALGARFGPYVAVGPAVYGGFSRGAYLGVSVIAANPGRFPLAVLGEGGQDPWTPERVQAFARGGGRRVLFACSTAECEVRAAPAITLLERAGVETRLASSGRIGHIVDDRVVTRIRQEWSWLVHDRTGEMVPW